MLAGPKKEERKGEPREEKKTGGKKKLVDYKKRFPGQQRAHSERRTPSEKSAASERSKAEAQQVTDFISPRIDFSPQASSSRRPKKESKHIEVPRFVSDFNKVSRSNTLR